MGFWSLLFPSDEDRIAQARRLIDEGELDKARALLFTVKGEVAEQLFNKAGNLLERERQGPPLVIEEMQPDGTRRLRFGQDVLEFNVPHPETAVPFSNDPLEIATAVLQHYRARDLGEYGEFTFVEAVWLLTERHAPMPNCDHPWRAALAQLTTAAANGDVERALAVLLSPRAKSMATIIAPYIEVLLARRFCKQVARHILTHNAVWMAGAQLMAELGANDPDLCLRVLDLENDPRRRSALLLEALLSSIDAGHPSTALSQRWEKDAEAGDEIERLENEVRLAARSDLERAHTAWTRIVDEVGDRDLATESYLSRLAKVDAARALELSVREQRSGADDLPRLLACLKAGVDVAHLLDDYIESLTAYSYKPYNHFALLVELSLRLDDADRLRKTLERGGPAGWQIALAAREGIRLLAEAGSSNLPTMMEICCASYQPGVVAGRDLSAPGIHGGHGVLRSDWLAFRRPRPVETLYVVAALGPGGPRWHSDGLA